MTLRKVTRALKRSDIAFPQFYECFACDGSCEFGFCGEILGVAFGEIAGVFEAADKISQGILRAFPTRAFMGFL